MAKFVNDSVLDAALDQIAEANLMIICSAQPTTRAEAVTTYALATVAMDSGDYSKADGDTSGRKLIVAAQIGVSVDNSGAGNHIALVTDTDLKYVTTMTAQALPAGSNLNIPAFDIELRDPS